MTCPDPTFQAQCGCTLLVALGAAYVAYHHGRTFAPDNGVDPTTAAL